MKTQISRTSFDVEQRYSGVYQQMGRMITDADWNELSDLVKFQVMDALQDVIGSGSPRARGIVKFTEPSTYELRWGHLYVDGIHARVLPNPDVLSPQFNFAQQADFPAAPTLTAGEYRLYADVWDRTVTALEDISLLDPGLKGADTCTRTQTMAQVKACATSISLDDIQNNPAINPAIGTLKMSLAIRAGKTLKDPCDPCADELALQDEVGNYLFRIEIHDVKWSSDAVPQMTELVIKWSSENGAEQYVVGQMPPGFSSSKWCYEFFSGPDDNVNLNMTTEKHLGHHLLPGFAPTRGKLVDGYPSTEPANLPLVRRWDGYLRLQKIAGVWTLAEGADRGRVISNDYSNTDHAFIDLTGPVIINLNETLLTCDLTAALAVAGDYWQAPVRQSIHNAGSVLLDKVLPSGILHHYFVLGRIQVNSSGGITGFTPERGDICTPFDFPPLTDIEARDVCYDNHACDMPNVRTVQEALDYLCRQRNLKWHNKHLHGMGVVCGLKVQCTPARDSALVEPDPAQRVNVTSGYALSCDGDDLVLKNAKSFNVIQAIQRLQAESAAPILDATGNGSVCLYIDLPETGTEPALKIALNDSSTHKNALLDGTIWMDFYEHCIKDLLAAIKKELDQFNVEDISEEETKNGELVSVRRKKFTTLLNLLAYFLSKPNGAYVFTSQKEHVILRDFYLNIRDILQSKTFCGMFKGHDFPAYPFPETRMSTYFGRDHHQRLLVHPGFRYLVTYEGTDTSINFFDTQTETLIATTKVPSGQGGETTAVTFSNDGKLIFAAVDINGMDSIVSRGRFEAGKVIWETSAVLCSVLVSDMRFDPKQENFLFLLGRGDGLYVVDIRKLFTEEKIIPAPSYRFNAVGHVEYDFDKGLLFATAANTSVVNAKVYDRIVVVPISEAIANMGKTPIIAQEVLLRSVTGAVASGEDGIALKQSDSNGASELYVIINGGNSKKQIWFFNMISGSLGSGFPTSTYQDLDDSEIRLAYHPAIGRLIVAVQDEHRLQIFDKTQLVVDRIPVQVLPTALAINKNDGSLYALNFASNTISAIPQNEFQVSAAFIAALAAYRWNVLLAFIALAGNLLQNLKDCFCHLLLMKCPDCDEKDKVWLATITVKDNEVYKICNIGKRKDVWTFPKFEYWLSLVPILPVLKAGLSKFCCAILPNIFDSAANKFQSQSQSYSIVKGTTYKQSVMQAKRTDVKVLWRDNLKTVTAPSALVRDKLLFPQRKLSADGLDKKQLMNMQTTEAVAQMEQKGLQVDVQEYSGDQASMVFEKYQQTPTVIPENSRVTVYQKNGRVLFYAAEPKTNTEFKTQGEVSALVDQLNTLKKERNIAQQELAEMQSGMAQLNGSLKEMHLEIAKIRPVRDIAGVDEKTHEILRKQGVLTVNDLATVETAKLIDKGVDAKKVEAMVSDAQNRLNLLR
jgi:hypothetical protein